MDNLTRLAEACALELDRETLRLDPASDGPGRDSAQVVVQGAADTVQRGYAVAPGGLHSSAQRVVDLTNGSIVFMRVLVTCPRHLCRLVRAYLGEYFTLKCDGQEWRGEFMPERVEVDVDFWCGRYVEVQGADGFWMHVGIDSFIHTKEWLMNLIRTYRPCEPAVKYPSEDLVGFPEYLYCFE